MLGRLDPERLLAVTTPVTLEHVRAIFETRLARPLGLSVDEAAAAVIRLANTHMAGAIRMVSLSRGLDPRDFTLFAFGGAGPLHAVALAQELGLPEVLIPARPGLTNALGCLVADLRQDFVNTLNVPLDGVDMATCMRRWPRSASAASPSTPRSRARSSRRWCCTAPTCSSAARRT